MHLEALYRGSFNPNNKQRHTQRIAERTSVRCSKAVKDHLSTIRGCVCKFKA